MKSIFKLSVRGYELDSFGHVNNAVYLQYAEAAKWDFFYKSGMIDEMKANNLFPVILENKLRYMHELRMMDCITITTDWKCSGKIISFMQTLFNDTMQQTSCRISGKLIYTNSERIMCDVPAELIEYLESDGIVD
ncbi:MAG: thioesterase family protein [Ruminococcus sp.]|nr:thioesterase family protein [Ruminococcus sp.]